MPRASWRGFLRLSLVSCPIYLSPAMPEPKEAEGLIRPVGASKEVQADRLRSSLNSSTSSRASASTKSAVSNPST
jgi:hypothetical protein